MTAEHWTLAKLLHDTYEEKAKEYGWKTQDSCKVEFKDLPQANKDVMLAVAERILDFYISKEKVRSLVV